METAQNSRLVRVESSMTSLLMGCSSEYVTAGVQAGAIVILLSIAVNLIGSSSGISQLELSYQHMLIALLV